jgi:predicted metalloprotease with PDZ domain
VFDGERAARDLERLVRPTAVWGSLPTTVRLLQPAGERSGGLEHKNSVTMMASRWATGTRDKSLPG